MVIVFPALQIRPTNPVLQSQFVSPNGILNKDLCLGYRFEVPSFRLPWLPDIYWLSSLLTIKVPAPAAIH